MQQPAPPEAPLWQSRHGLFLLLLAIFFVQLLQNGYACFRSDHLTQIPLLYLQHDPSLFAHDWFLQKYGHFDVRFFHLLLLKLFALPLGLAPGILILYMILILATLAAWVRISEHLFESPLPGLVACLIAVFMNGVELGSNHLVENIMIPRTEAYAFAYWGLVMVLLGRPFCGGLLLAIGGYFQQAIGPLFAVPILIWLLVRPEARPLGRTWREPLRFAVGFVVAFLVPLFFLRHGGVLAAGGISSQEYIQLAAYIRHPHHMVPHLWRGMWLEFALLCLLFLLQRERLRQENPRAWSFSGLALVIMGLLAVSTIFIEWIPIKAIVILQPYRMAVLLYFVIALTLAPHVLELLTRRDALARARGIMLILFIPCIPAFCALAAAEALLLTRERRGRPLPRGLALGLLALALAVPLLLVEFPSEYRKDLKPLLVLTALLVGAITLAARWRLHERPRLLRRVLTVALAGGLLLISCQFWLPLERWLDSGKPYQKKLAGLCWKYQFNPIAIKGLERLGAWAANHTPKDAVFIIPPDRQPPGFHIWSKRAAVFSLKFFPYNPHGLLEWKERYLAIHGVTETSTPGGKMARDEAMNDIGGGLMDKCYDNLTPTQILYIAEKYGADYMITQTRYQDKRLVSIHTDFDHTKNMDHAKHRDHIIYKIARNQALLASGDKQHHGEKQLQ